MNRLAKLSKEHPWKFTFGTFGIYCGIYWLTTEAVKQFDPAESYDTDNDSELESKRRELMSQFSSTSTDWSERHDWKCSDRLVRRNPGKVYKHQWFGNFMKSIGCRGDGGYITHWRESDGKHYEALVRADGKILSEIEEVKRYSETKLFAKVEGGYLVGVADCFWFAGKGKYPIYKFSD